MKTTRNHKGREKYNVGPKGRAKKEKGIVRVFTESSLKTIKLHKGREKYKKEPRNSAFQGTS